MGRRWVFVVLGALLLAPAGIHQAIARDARPAPVSDVVRVYVFAGQSNMVGASTRTSDLARVAPELTQTENAVLFFGPTDDRAVRWAPMSTVTERAQSFYGPGFGPELSAAHRLAALHPGERIAIVKYARNGTSLHTDWDPNRPGSLYAAMLVRTRAAMRSLASLTHARVRLSGFFWMQGEWDTDTRAHASAYRANLARLIARVRTDLDAPRLPFVIGRIRDIRTFNPHRPFSDVVRAAQAGAADTDPNAFLVSTDGLSLDPRSRIHFDTHGTVGLGERFAQRRFGL